MKPSTLLATACVALLASCCEEKAVFEYCNPLTTLTFRDTHIIPDGGRYYAVGTCTPVWGGQNPGVKLYVSDDLRHWTYSHMLIDAYALDSTAWYKDRFWAPEIRKVGTKYLLTFNCQNNGGAGYADVERQRHYHACGLAVADHIEGPYTVVTPDEPLTPFASNDMSLFQDTDGRVYCFFNNGWTSLHRIYVAELDTLHYRLKEYPVELIAQEPGKWDGAGIEGAHVVKKDGIYYLFYSSWTNGYAVGYATARHIYGPWTKSADNPLFGSFTRSDTTYIVRRGVATPAPDFHIDAIGHNQVFVGPDGNYWTSYHGNLRGMSEAITLIDPIELHDGKVTTPTPTYTPQRIEYTPGERRFNLRRNGIREEIKGDKCR